MSADRNRNFFTRKTVLGLLVVLGVVALLAIAVIVPAINTIFDNVVTSDCIWTHNAKVWIDENKDGVKGSDEQPLANVQFYVDDVLNGGKQMSVGVSDANGDAPLYLFIPGCPKVEMEIYPQAPTGYCFTTLDRVKDEKDVVDEFGLAACA